MYIHYLQSTYSWLRQEPWKRQFYLSAAHKAQKEFYGGFRVNSMESQHIYQMIESIRVGAMPCRGLL